MKKETIKKLLLIAISLIVIGSISLFISLAINSWDYNKITTTSYKNDSFNISEPFDKISIDSDTSDIEFIRAQDINCTVDFYQPANADYSTYVSNNTLYISAADSKSLFDHISFISNETAKIKIYLPNSFYTSLQISDATGDIMIPKSFSFDSIDISTSTGDVSDNASAKTISINNQTGETSLNNVLADQIDLTCSTGDTTLIDVTSDYINSTGSTGDLDLINVNATKIIKAERSTGDITLSNSDAYELYLETSTGSVSGSLLSGKTFVTSSSTGDIDVPSSTGGKCEIKTSTGDITITIN